MQTPKRQDKEEQKESKDKKVCQLKRGDWMATNDQ